MRSSEAILNKLCAGRVPNRAEEWSNGGNQCKRAEQGVEQAFEACVEASPLIGL